MSSGGSSLAPLLRQLGSQLSRQKRLVLAIIVVGLLQALAVKGPFLLLVEIGQLFGNDISATPGTSNRLFAAFRTVKIAFLDSVGLDHFVPRGIPSSVEYQRAVVAGSAVMIAVLAVFGAVTVWAFRILANLAATRAVVDLRNHLCGHMMRLSVRFFSKQRTGELISTVSNDTNTIRHSYTLLFENTFLEPLMILTNAVLAASVHWGLGLFVLAMVPVLMLPMGRFGRKVRKSSSKSLAALGDATDAMSQMFSGVRTVKAFQLEEREIAEFHEINERFLIRTMRMVKSKAKSQGFLYLIYMGGFAGIIYSLQFVFSTGAQDIDRGNLFMAVAAVGTTYQHIKRTARTYNLLKESQGAMDRIQVYLDTQPEIHDSGAAEPLENPRGDIEFRSVSFAYDSDPVLSGLSFRVRPGEKIAFVGSSGAGKSTVLDLLMRFYDPDEGTILIDGRDLRTVALDSYLPRLAIVDQHPFLFNATIRENILQGRQSATESDLVAAARAAFVDEFVDRLPDGFDTVVGERGTRLSGGQLQRITIARAIIRDPVVLLLDEATSSLDTASEQQVQLALANLMAGRTSFMVAHRLSTVRGADRILFLEDGRILEEGSHDELMAQPESAYRRLSLLQT